MSLARRLLERVRGNSVLEEGIVVDEEGVFIEAEPVSLALVPQGGKLLVELYAGDEIACDIGDPKEVLDALTSGGTDTKLRDSVEGIASAFKAIKKKLIPIFTLPSKQ